MFLSHQHETTLPPIVASPAKSVKQLKQQQIQTPSEDNNNNNNVDENTKLSDCQRLLICLHFKFLNIIKKL